MKQDFHQIQTKFVHTSLIISIITNSITPSGPKKRQKETKNGEAGKTQFKMNIVKGKEEELKAETENFSDVLWKKAKKK